MLKRIALAAFIALAHTPTRAATPVCAQVSAVQAYAGLVGAETVVLRGAGMDPFIAAYNTVPGDLVDSKPDYVLVAFREQQAFVMFVKNDRVCNFLVVPAQFARELTAGA